LPGDKKIQKRQALMFTEMTLKIAISQEKGEREREREREGGGCFRCIYV